MEESDNIFILLFFDQIKTFHAVLKYTITKILQRPESLDHNKPIKKAVVGELG